MKYMFNREMMENYKLRIKRTVTPAFAGVIEALHSSLIVNRYSFFYFSACHIYHKERRQKLTSHSYVLVLSRLL
jgi:hypothetical protein